MTFWRIFFFAGGLVLAGAIYWALEADGRGLGVVLAEMFAAPWTVVTLIDLYLGFAIAAAMMLLVEKNRLIALFWALPVFFLGNVWTALWLVIRLPEIARRLAR